MKVLLFGATGSIGKQTLEVIKHLNYSLVGFSYYSNKTAAKKIIKQHKNIHYFSPINKSSVGSYEELIKKTKPDLIVNAIIGFAGLDVTLLALKHKITLALANKESLVVAGKFVTQLAKKNNVKLLPIDSEHAAIYQALINRRNSLNRIYITASGGPFYKKKNLSYITYKQAIKHPNWNMGPKISIDSATLMNKCFEIIEAYWLYGTKNIIPIYHPQSIVHSMVELKDGSIIAINSLPDMKLPIQLALTNFNSTNKSLIKPLRFDNLNLCFNYIDENKWTPLKWAKQAINSPDSSLAVVLNAANEEAICLFAKNKIKFNQIKEVVKFAINNIKIIKINNISQIYIVDQLTRKIIRNTYNK